MILLIFVAIVVIFLGFLGLGMWIGVGKFANNHSEKLGTNVTHVLIQFILVLFIILALFYFTVGTDRCNGFLCGLEMFVFFLIGSSVIFLTWPVVIHFYYRKKKADYKKKQ
ncbi:MAG: hypothetical protein ACI8ZM_004461 [Crocinitomix sp.]